MDSQRKVMQKDCPGDKTASLRDHVPACFPSHIRNSGSSFLRFADSDEVDTRAQLCGESDEHSARDVVRKDANAAQKRAQKSSQTQKKNVKKSITDSHGAAFSSPKSQTKVNVITKFKMQWYARLTT